MFVRNWNELEREGDAYLALAAAVMALAIDDWRKGKGAHYEQYHLRDFFQSEWFATLSRGLGIDPVDVHARLQVRIANPRSESRYAYAHASLRDS